MYSDILRQKFDICEIWLGRKNSVNHLYGLAAIFEKYYLTWAIYYASGANPWKKLKQGISDY
jgi:hypothetical protein